MSEAITNDVIVENTSNNEVFNVQALIKALENYEHFISNADDKYELETVLSVQFLDDMLKEFIAYGDSLFNSNESPDLRAIYSTHYQLPDIIKKIAVLNRDSLLELTINSVHERDFNIDQEKLHGHFKKVKAVLLKAVAATKVEVEKFRNEIIETSVSSEQINRLVSNRQNPWLVYKGQFLQIIDQTNLINISHKEVLNIHDHFQSLIKVLRGIDKQFLSLLNYYKELIATVSNAIASKESKETADFNIEKSLERVAQMGNVQRSVQLNEDIADITKQLELEDLPVRSTNGILEVRHIQLSLTVQKWLDYEIYPLLADLYAIEENLKLKMHLRLTGLNKLLSLNKELPILELHRVFNLLNDELDKSQELSLQINNQINLKIKDELHIAAFYTQEQFLNVPIQTTLEKSSKDAFSVFGGFFKQKLKVLKSWYRENTFEQERSPLQQTTTCIAERMQFTELSHYDSLFMNRNFIGDLFYIVRRKQEMEFVETVKEWNASFAKTVLITGASGSGKSTFLQQTVKRFFKNQIIQLQPHATITLDGRKFNTSMNLHEALDEIKRINQVHRSRPVLCIDNLESWGDDNHTIVKNVRDLLNFIEEESQDIFIVVSCSTLFKNHLSKRFKFEEHFSSILDMTRSSVDEIVKAVRIRHETSHKALRNDNRELMDSSMISKKIQSLANQSDYNMGTVLQSWAFHTVLAGEDDVIVHDTTSEFAPFFNDAELVVLKQVVIYKHTSERSLKRITALDYDLKYKSAIRRLINTKILIRNLEGKLYLNPVISHEVESIFLKNLKS